MVFDIQVANDGIRLYAAYLLFGFHFSSVTAAVLSRITEHVNVCNYTNIYVITGGGERTPPILHSLYVARAGNMYMFTLPLADMHCLGEQWQSSGIIPHQHQHWHAAPLHPLLPCPSF